MRCKTDRVYYSCRKRHLYGIWPISYLIDLTMNYYNVMLNLLAYQILSYCLKSFIKYSFNCFVWYFCFLFFCLIYFEHVFMNGEAKKNTCNTRKHINKNITISINNKWGYKFISMLKILVLFDDSYLFWEREWDT